MILSLPFVEFQLPNYEQDMFVACEIVATSGNQPQYRLWLGYGDSQFCSVATNRFDIGAVSALLKRGEKEWIDQIDDSADQLFPKEKYAEQLGVLLLRVSELRGKVE